MADHTAKGEEFEKKAEKKINRWGLFGSKYEYAAEFYEKSANSFKLAKAWDRAGSVFIKLLNCHLKCDSIHDAATAYVNAANCYKKTSAEGAISCLDQAMNIFLDIGRHNMAAKHCKEIGDLYELEQNTEKVILYFERAAELFEYGEASTSANQCKQKVAEFSAQSGQCQKAIEIYEAIARQSINNNLLKYGVRGYLLNAGLCQLCKGDVISINNALERYEDLDPTFSRTREYKFLADLASATDEEDVEKFTGVIREFYSITRLVAKWMLSKGQGATMGTYDTLLLAFDMGRRVDEAESLWNMILHVHTRSISKQLFSRMISLYDHHDMQEKIIEVFADMEWCRRYQSGQSRS